MSEEEGTMRAEMFEMMDGETVRSDGAGIAGRPDSFGDEMSVEG